MKKTPILIALADNKTIVDRIREYLESNDWGKRYFDRDIAELLGINSINICVHKKRNDYVFKVIALDWCIDQDIDPRKMLAK